MSLITRCPACGTMFKVVADQLKVSQGWVRCGHCSEVFDASLHLQSGQSAPAPVPPQQFQPEPAPQPYDGYDTAQQPPQPVAAREYGDDPSWSPGVFFTGIQPLQPSQAAGVPSAYGYSGNAGYSQPLPDEKIPVPADADEYGEAVRVMAAEVQEEDPENHSTPLYTEDSVRGALPHEPDASHDVSFVRDAKRKAFWRKPAVRFALVICSLLLALALVLQVAVQQREQIAALQPGLKPWLNAVCEHLHCDVGPLRRIEAVVIDSSTFNKIDGDSYRLSFSLKNTGATPLAMPSLEVTLTDTQDQAVVRRVLSPAQFGASTNMLVTGADFAGFVVMQVLAADPTAATASAPLRVAGYRMLAFYP